MEGLVLVVPAVSVGAAVKVALESLTLDSLAQIPPSLTMGFLAVRVGRVARGVTEAKAAQVVPAGQAPAGASLS